MKFILQFGGLPQYQLGRDRLEEGETISAGSLRQYQLGRDRLRQGARAATPVWVEKPKKKKSQKSADDHALDSG